MAHFLQGVVRDPAAAWALVIERTGTVLARRVEPAFDPATRKRGLLRRSGLDPGTALVIAPSNAVHTFFMRFVIDVVFVSRDGTVVKVKFRVRPWRLAIAPRGFAVIELRAGGVEDAGLLCGDRLVCRVPPA
jgi:uncharacterized membrane protein (UPF0127 family)